MNDIEYCGDVYAADFSKYKGFDFLIGGSPCTYWQLQEKTQTLPDFYTDVDSVSTKMKYEVIGDGWTVDVIAWIFGWRIII